MKLTSTLALFFAATVLWNCNNTTQPETSSVDPRIPNTVNSISEYAALTAGYQITSRAAVLPETTDVEGFGPDMFKAFADAGICQNFVLILEELMVNIQGGGQSVDPFAASPRLQQVGQCLTDKAQGFSAGAEPSESQVLSLIDDCFCAGSGTLFGNFQFATYSAPGVPGKAYAAPGVPGKTYAAPLIPGYSAPAVPGKGYAPPSL